MDMEKNVGASDEGSPEDDASPEGGSAQWGGGGRHAFRGFDRCTRIILLGQFNSFCFRCTSVNHWCACIYMTCRSSFY